LYTAFTRATDPKYFKVVNMPHGIPYSRTAVDFHLSHPPVEIILPCVTPVETHEPVVPPVEIHKPVSSPTTIIKSTPVSIATHVDKYTDEDYDMIPDWEDDNEPYTDDSMDGHLSIFTHHPPTKKRKLNTFVVNSK